MKQRLGLHATRAVAQVKKCDFSPALATRGGGHIHVPGVALGNEVALRLATNH